MRILEPGEVGSPGFPRPVAAPTLEGIAPGLDEVGSRLLVASARRTIPG
jgi:hypothetical protein